MILNQHASKNALIRIHAEMNTTNKSLRHSHATASSDGWKISAKRKDGKRNFNVQRRSPKTNEVNKKWKLIEATISKCCFPGNCKGAR
eukprot:749147-Hanusia_phi.AAC.4